MTPASKTSLVANVQACAACGPVTVSMGGIPYNNAHIEYWKSRALTAEAQRDGAYEECAKIAEAVGNFGNYKREELTLAYGQPRFDMMQSIASAIRAARLKPDQKEIHRTKPESTQNI